jgi:hypothetical protein
MLVTASRSKGRKSAVAITTSAFRRILASSEYPPQITANDRMSTRPGTPYQAAIKPAHISQLSLPGPARKSATIFTRPKGPACILIANIGSRAYSVRLIGYAYLGFLVSFLPGSLGRSRSIDGPPPTPSFATSPLTLSYAAPFAVPDFPSSILPIVVTVKVVARPQTSLQVSVSRVAPTNSALGPPHYPCTRHPPHIVICCSLFAFHHACGASQLQRD